MCDSVVILDKTNGINKVEIIFISGSSLIAGIANPKRA